MRTNPETIKEIETLFQQYEKEVIEAENKGFLQANTTRTYLVHTSNFVKWCKGQFEPGGRNK